MPRQRPGERGWWRMMSKGEQGARARAPSRGRAGGPRTGVDEGAEDVFACRLGSHLGVHSDIGMRVRECARSGVLTARSMSIRAVA